MREELEAKINELIGVGKILDILWTGSYSEMGRMASERIEKELIYYFGKNWTTTMYKFIGEKNGHFEQLKTLKELKQK